MRCNVCKVLNAEVWGYINTSYENLQSYKDRVENYIRKNKDHLTVNKLRNNISITKKGLNSIEEILFTESVAGTKQQFVDHYGEKPLGEFIRSITVLEQSAVNEAFANFLQVGELRADQMTFINTIISYLTKNGTIDVTMLYSSPFIDINHEGIDGVFDLEKKQKFVSIIEQINYNAIA